VQGVRNKYDALALAFEAAEDGFGEEGLADMSIN
jgi:hypothetical protein